MTDFRQRLPEVADGSQMPMAATTTRGWPTPPAPPAAPRSWSVIVCQRKGRSLSLHVLGAGRVGGCACALRGIDQDCFQDVRASRVMPHRPLAQRPFAPLAPSARRDPYLWGVPRSGPLALHLAVAQHAQYAQRAQPPRNVPSPAPPLSPSPSPSSSASQPLGGEGLWMPTARRLLLEPAPRRPATRGPPYGQPYGLPNAAAAPLITRPSRPRPPAPAHSHAVESADEHPLGGRQLLRTHLEGGLRPPRSRPPTCAPAEPSPRPPALRVLRPEELVLKRQASFEVSVAGPAPLAVANRPDGLDGRPAATSTRAPSPQSEESVDSGVDSAVADDAAGDKSPATESASPPATPTPSPRRPSSSSSSQSTPTPAKAAKAGKAVKAGKATAEDAERRVHKRQWLLRVVRENFNEQIGLLVERFVRRPRHDKSVRRVPGIGRKVNINLQDFWRRRSGQDKHMKTKDLLTVYSDSGLDWRAFQKWLTKELQFMPSCAKLCALSLDIYQKYWSTDWDDATG